MTLKNQLNHQIGWGTKTMNNLDRNWNQRFGGAFTVPVSITLPNRRNNNAKLF
jgi:hypothetical protein